MTEEGAMAQEKRALVTGAAGFIGSALCETLAKRGWSVLGIDNINSYYDISLKIARLRRMGLPEEAENAGKEPVRSDKYPSLSFLRADITDREMMESLFSSFRPTAIMNLAAQAGVRYSIENPYTYVTNNVDGFLVILECARHYPVERFVYASSSSVYGANAKIPFSEEDSVDYPVSLYAATKKSNEMMARAYHTLYGIRAIGLRFFTVYGPWGRPDMAPMLFASAISKGKSIKVFNQGNMKRDFTYVGDIVEGIGKVMEGKDYHPRRDIYNIGHGSPVDLMEFISLMEKAFGREAIKEYLPMQKGDVPATYADTTRLKDDYGYEATTTLEDGIREFAAWYQSDLNPLR